MAIASVCVSCGLLPTSVAYAGELQPVGAVAVTVESAPFASSTDGWFERQTVSIVDARTGLVRGLVNGGEPRFSPNGRWIAFCRSGLWVMRSDGRERVRLARKECSSPAWAPDSRRIAFSDGHDIYRATRRGGRVLRIGSADTAGALAPPPCPGTECALSRDRTEPSWSSRGEIAFTERVTETVRNGEYEDAVGDVSGVGVMRADGSNPRPFAGSRSGASPDWSPGGRRIAFARNGWIWTVDRAGRALRRLARGQAPAWSPNGRWVAFTRRAFSSSDGFGPLYSDLLVVPAAGGRTRQIARATSHRADVRGRSGPERSFADPSWRPGKP